MSKIIKLILITFVIASCFANSACRPKEPDKIIGKWERFDDSAEGTRVEVVLVGDQANEYQARLIHLEGILIDLGFKKDEIKWKSITKKNKDYYLAEDLLKATNEQEEIAFSRYDDVYIEMVSDDILHIKGFAEAEEALGTEQKWRRIDY